jgi:hypothetical protein
MGRPRKTASQFAPAQATICDDYEDEIGLTADLTSASDDPNADHSSSLGRLSNGTTTGPTSITSSSITSAPTTRQATVGIWDSGPVGRVDAALIGQPSSISPETFWRNPLHPFQVNDAAIPNASGSGMADHGYIAVLTALARLEQSVAAGPPTPSVELVLRTERDFRVLKHRIFTCRDYATYDEEPTFLSVKPPALLTLSLLAERVVSMLEGKFRATVSTMSARLMDPDVPTQEHELTQTPSFLTSSNEQAAATGRRLGRSFRGFLDQPCVFPVPGGKAEIRFGVHKLGMPATARAIKAVLQVRLRKMLAALLDMQGELERQDQTQVDVAHGLLDWGDSDALLRGTASNLVQNLIRRLEGLQGAMVLMG